MNPQETELGQEVMEETDAPPCHRHNNHNIWRNHSNQEKRYRRCEAPAGGSAGGRARALQKCRPQEEQDTELQNGAQSPQPQLSQPIPRPAVTRYRRQGDSEARIRAQQQRHRQRQQREAERAQHLAQQEKQQHAEMAHEDERERDDSVLARSASTESGFHTHTDRAEGDDGLVMMSLEPEGQPEAEDEVGNYGVQLRPEAEGYTESAEAEQQHLHSNPNYPPQPPPLPCDPLPDIQNPQRQDQAEMLNVGYSNYVYTQPLSHTGGRVDVDQSMKSLDPGLVDEAYSEPYDIYSPSEHVYEEICDAPTPVSSAAGRDEDTKPLQQRRAGFQLFDSQTGGGDYHQQEAVGSRLRHYDERSDGESDSPEKEAEFAPYPRADSCDQEEDIDSIVAEVKESLSSQSLHCAVKNTIDEESELLQEEEKNEPEPPTNLDINNKTANQMNPAREAISPSEEPVAVRNTQEKRDAISLAIKDIKEAIEEVKNKTVRSPYTPDEPKEPIWVMRQDLSPTPECDLQPTLGVDVSRAALMIINLY